MENNLPDSAFDYFNFFSYISKLMFAKYKKISYLVSFVYLTAVLKLKPKTLKVKAVSCEQLEELFSQSDYKFDFIGDLQSCALLSVNTLIALSISNKSWLKITGLCSNTTKELVGEFNDSSWKIRMPPVEKNESDGAKNYYIQCLCASSIQSDFVLYVTDVKLFNLIKFWNKSDTYCDLVHKVKIENVDCKFHSQIAKSVVVAGITTENDLMIKDYEDILHEYFKKPKYLKVNEVFQVDVLKYGRHLRSRITLCNVKHIYYKVISIIGESDKQEFFVVKGYTNLYLNPPVHSYIPQKQIKFVKTHEHLPGFEDHLYIDGLVKYYEELRRIFRPFLKSNNVKSRGMFLLSGPKGVGKKTSVKHVAASYGLHLIQVDCFDFYGLNASLLQGKFDQLFAKARRTVPCVLYLENTELLGREQNYHENPRIIDIFENQIKELYIRKSNAYPLIIVGSTQSKASELVPAIRRLFIKTVKFETPKFEEISQILKYLVRSFNMICSSSDLNNLAEKVRGYLFADLALLLKHAILNYSQDCADVEGGNRVLLQKHFNKGIEIMESAYSDSIGAARVPTVHWEDIGGLGDLKEEIMNTLNLPLKHPELFSSGLKRLGIMFYGPPGTGKTLLAKAVATECNYNFLSVKGPELMNMYVGESEKNVREVFERAREAAPCIIFFDELDSLAPSRGKSGDSGGVVDRVVSQLLTEMDGLDSNKDVFVIAATNRPDLVDSALLRPGRFDKTFYIGICTDEKSKLSVLKALTRKFCLSNDVDFEKIIKDLPNHVTGADLYSLCSNAWFCSLRKAVNLTDKGNNVALPLEVSSDDFSNAISQFVPSLTVEDIDYYEKLRSFEK